MSRFIKTTCKKCKTEITLDFGDASYDEAYDLIQKMDSIARECPGHHVEIGGWRNRWNLDEALDKAYTDDEKLNSKIVYKTIVQVNNDSKEFIGNDIEEDFLNFIKFMQKKYPDSKIKVTEFNRVGELLYEETYQFSDLLFIA